MQPTQPTIPPIPGNPAPMGPKKTNKKATAILVTLGVLILAGIGVLAYLLWGTGPRIDAEQPVGTITINSGGYSPSTLTVKKGQEVSWVNEDEAPHQIYADQQTAPSLNSGGPLVKGDSYIYTFEATGTVNFYDPSDPTKYKGTIIVE